MTSAYERASQFLEGAKRNRREIVTPEGVPLPVDVANVGERLTAFVIDLFFWFCAVVAIYLLLIFLVLSGVHGVVVISLFLFLAFIVRNLYFVHFELAWQGATPGKRIVGLRVVDRQGGALLPSAVIARNLTREIETFIPVGILLTFGGARGSAAAWEQLSLLVWLLFFAALPFINRDRMRGGDLIAGTMVITLPRRVLLSDLVERAVHFTFTDKQLSAYGAFELQVLEELLRRPGGLESTRLLREVCEKICRRIEWPGAVPEAETLLFLREFYTAERAYLEREQLFGKPREDKHHGRSGV